MILAGDCRKAQPVVETPLCKTAKTTPPMGVARTTRLGMVIGTLRKCIANCWRSIDSRTLFFVGASQATEFITRLFATESFSQRDAMKNHHKRIGTPLATPRRP